MKIAVRLDKHLFLDFDADSLKNTICSSAFYKIQLRRYVASSTDTVIVFQNDLSYIVIKKIISCLADNAGRYGYELVVDDEVSTHIYGREMHLESRSKLGIEIKTHSPKIDEEYKLFSSIVTDSLERKLRERQMWDAFFMTSMKKSSNFSVPGSGKTSSVYAMFSFLHKRGLCKRIVVICPKNAFGPWIDEFEACFGAKMQLRLFNIHSPLYRTSAQRRSAIRYESGDANLLLFNYECIKTFEAEISSLIHSNTLLVFDEVHKVKRIDGEYARAAINIAKIAQYIVAMTGTPIPNSYSDIYNLLHILYSEEYQDYFGFNPSELKEPDASCIDRVNRKIQPFFCRTTKQQLEVPLPNSDAILPVPSSETENQLLRILIKKHKKNKLLLMLRILQLESFPQELLSAINLADYEYILEDEGDVDTIDYASYSTEIVDLINRSTVSTKVQQCVNLIKGLVLQHKPVIIWAIFVNTIKRLAQQLESEGIRVRCVYGEIELADRQVILEDFKSGKFDVLITNPNTLAESVSLHNICHDAVYFEYSFNLVHLLQSKDRIHRLGLAGNQYTQFYFFQTMYQYNNDYYSMDEQIYARLVEKEKRMLAAIDADTLERMPTTREELDMIFSQVHLAT